MPSRRDFYRSLSVSLGSAMAMVMAVPGLRFLLDPLFKKEQGGTFRALTRLDQLVPGKPQSFPILADRRDGWVKYPREPVGSVWLIRREAGASPEVVAFSGECPHKGCAIGVGGDGLFTCPCHLAKFGLDGRPLNDIPPRGMDSLEVELTKGPAPEVLVKFERFRPLAKEKKPLA